MNACKSAAHRQRPARGSLRKKRFFRAPPAGSPETPADFHAEFGRSQRGGLALFDLGNTALKIGLAMPGSPMSSYSLPNRESHTADSLGLSLLAILGHAGIAVADLEACVACSVVPALDPVLREAVARYLGCPAYFACQDLPVPLENRYGRPAEVGADRLVGAYAARRLDPDSPAIVVVDFGTAVTFDCVQGMAFVGGLIFPGPATALAALFHNTARLPMVSLAVEPGAPVVCRDTATSIQHGLVFGYASMVEGICRRLRSQLGSCRVLAAGGFAGEMARFTDVFDSVRPGLLLEGLRLLYCGQA